MRVDATRVYFNGGLLSRACHRAFWPLFFVRLVTEVELSPLQLVLLGTAFELSIFLSEIPTGVVADIFSRRLSVILSFVFVGAAMLLSGVVESYWLLLGSQILMGFGSTFESGAETAWITDELGSAADAEALILRRGQWQLGAGVIGILGFAALAAVSSVSTSLLVIGAIFIGWAAVLSFVMPEDGFTRGAGEGWSEFGRMLRAGSQQIGSVRTLRILAMVIFVGGLAKEALDRLDIKRLTEVGLPTDIDEALVVGAIVAVRLTVAAGLLLVARRRISGASVVPVMAVFLSFVAAGVFVLALSDLLAVAAFGLILQGGFHFATEPLTITWTNAFAPDRARATVHSFIGQAEAFGEVLGGIVLGTVAQVFTVSTAMILSGLLFAGSALYALTATRHWDLDAVPAGRP